MGDVENLTFDEFSRIDNELDIVAQKIEKKVRTTTVIVMLFDTINIIIAILWIIMIAFAWSMQPGSIGTFMMQFLYLPYVLVIHSFFGELRRFLDKLKRRLIPDPLVTYQTILYYLGTGFVITSVMITVTTLRFVSRIVVNDRLYWCAVALSIFIDIMAITQFVWIAYTLFSFIRTWSKVKSTKEYLDPSNAFKSLAGRTDNLLTSLFWNTAPNKVGDEIPRRKRQINYEI